MSKILKISIVFFSIFLFNLTIFGQNEKFLQNPVKLDSIYSETLKEQRTFYIQFPDEYEEKKDKKYPVAFILDGEFLLPTVHNFQGYYSGGFTPEMILVGISNLNNRARDLTPSKITENYGMAYQRENGEAVNFALFIQNDLIPYIEKKYPVTTYRSIIGHSYGGLFTIYTLLYHRELFTNYIAIDPSLDWDNQKLITDAKNILPIKDYEGKSLFMSLNGQLHMQNSDIYIENVMEDNTDYTLFPRSNITFKNLIERNKSNGLDFNWRFYPNDLHGTIQFPSIRDGLISTFKWFQMEDTHKINSFDTSREELYSIIIRRAKKLEKHFGYFVPPYPEELLNISGYMSMDMQNEERAKMYFELAIEYYPKSANAYDSMADYYEKNKDYENALKNVIKAYEISENDYYKQRIEAFKDKIN